MLATQGCRHTVIVREIVVAMVIAMLLLQLVAEVRNQTATVVASQRCQILQMNGMPRMGSD